MHLVLRLSLAVEDGSIMKWPSPFNLKTFNWVNWVNIALKLETVIISATWSKMKTFLFGHQFPSRFNTDSNLIQNIDFLISLEVNEAYSHTEFTTV